MADLRQAPPEVSVVVPVYGNAGTLADLHGQLQHVLRSLRLAYEIVFVNDACPHGSLSVLQDIATRDPHVKVVALPHNVGQHQAVLIGLQRAQGRCAVIMDGDLQDPPDAIPRMLEEMAHGQAAVFAGRRGQYESAGRLVTSRLFKGLLHLLSGVPRDAGMFVVINRAMIERLCARRDPHPFVVAMIGRSGLPMTSIPIRRSPRPSGATSYSSWMRVRAGWSAVRIALRAPVREDPR